MLASLSSPRLFLAAALLALAGAAPAPAPGIAIDSDWRRAVHAHAREKLQHPAWGWRHSERDYLLARSIAKAERLAIDDDVLFAAAFLHDAGAIAPFAQDGVDHAARSAELAEPLLRDAGFPMEKFARVRAAILGHMFDKTPEGAEATVLHDADTIDFLGATGVARRLSVTAPATDIDGGLARIDRFADELPGRLVTPTAREMAGERVRAMKDFLRRLQRETPPGARP
jgi:uncharacterized protein